MAKKFVEYSNLVLFVPCSFFPEMTIVAWFLIEYQLWNLVQSQLLNKLLAKLKTYVESMMINPVTIVSIITFPVRKLNRKDDLKVSMICWSFMFLLSNTSAVAANKAPNYTHCPGYIAPHHRQSSNYFSAATKCAVTPIHRGRELQHSGWWVTAQRMGQNKCRKCCRKMWEHCWSK